MAIVRLESGLGIGRDGFGRSVCAEWLAVGPRSPLERDVVGIYEGTAYMAFYQRLRRWQISCHNDLSKACDEQGLDSILEDG